MAFIIDPISPVAFSILGFQIRWYALAYIIAFVLGFFGIKKLTQNKTSQIYLTKKQTDDLFTSLILGVIIGGRLGYVLFYNLSFFIQNPLEIFMLWHGGMSFHGGLIGVIIATILFVYKQHFTNQSVIKNSLKILDLLSVVAPIGLFFGRIANFINMEVMGRPTNSVFGIIFNGQTNIPRHPSPLYEAFCEGILLFTIMYLLYTKTTLTKKAGALSGCMCILYAIFRIFCEQFRAPDIQIGFLTSWGLTMGQLLSVIMFVLGGILIYYSHKTKDIQ
ncbi:MAG: prolipoprotein diacylglyceryl transferase [Alphaproteobacteria bacterium]|nr:prolipoprotein diacylglyceryl transferase [Alphaproteobacteria bacterium]